MEHGIMSKSRVESILPRSVEIQCISQHHHIIRRKRVLDLCNLALGILRAPVVHCMNGRRISKIHDLDSSLEVLFHMGHITVPDAEIIGNPY